MPKRSVLRALACLLLAGCCSGAVNLWIPHPSSNPTVARAQEGFFKSLVYNCQPRHVVRPLLDQAIAAAPDDPEVHLLDGMYGLWRSGEEVLAPADERAVLLATRDALTRYRNLRPDDGRAASWLEGTNFRIARLDGDAAAQSAAIERLEDAHDRDTPHRLFHNLTLALMLFHQPAPAAPCPDFGIQRALENVDGAAPTCRDVQPLFCRGLCYLSENAHGCSRRNGCRMSVLWPHTISGFLLVTADYHLKAGDLAGARRILQFVRAISELAPFHYLVRDRLARPEVYAASFRDPAYPAPGQPHMIMDTPEVACRLCHLSEQASRLSFVTRRPMP